MASANKLLHIYYASITTYLNLKTQAGTWSHTNHFFGRLPFQIWIAQQSGFMWPFSLIRNLEISTWLLLAGLFVAKLVSVVGSEMALKSRNINHLKHQIHWGTRLWGVYLFRQRKTYHEDPNYIIQMDSVIRIFHFYWECDLTDKGRGI